MDSEGNTDSTLLPANYKYAEKGKVVERVDEKAKLPIKNSQGIYEINDEKELRGFADIVKGYEQYMNSSNTGGINRVKAETSANAILTKDIEVIDSTNTYACSGLQALLAGTKTIDTLDSTKKTALEDLNWVPIGDNHEISSGVYCQYTGTFDGAGHTISGIYCNVYNASGSAYVGLFGYVGEGGEIKNLGIKNSYISGNGTGSNGSSDVGGVVGFCGGTVTSSYGENNTLIGNGTTSNVGGVVGFCAGAGLNKRIVKNCYGANNKISGTGNNSNVGGVIGICGSGGEVKSCYGANIDLTGTNKGGICGSGLGTISNCYYLKDAEQRINESLYGIGGTETDDEATTRATSIGEFKGNIEITVDRKQTTVLDALNAERKVFIKNINLKPGSHEYLLLVGEYEKLLKIPVRVKINYDPSNNLEKWVQDHVRHEFFRKSTEDWESMTEGTEYKFDIDLVSTKIGVDGTKTQDFIFSYYIFKAEDTDQFGFNKSYINVKDDSSNYGMKAGNAFMTYMKQDVGGGKKLFIDYDIDPKQILENYENYNSGS